ncbi:MAG: signal peptidase I [Clostridiales bacterium]|nr:signal peptidase I [Clostridiales bacterium]
MNKKIVFIVLEILFILLLLFFWGITYIQGDSMEPELSSGDWVLYLKNTEYANGDVVIFNVQALDKWLIKRVVAETGDEIRIIDNELWIGNSNYGNSYMSDSYILDLNEYFVIGDNIENSEDSRSERIGIINKNNIAGKAVFRIFPFKKFGKLGE